MVRECYVYRVGGFRLIYVLGVVDGSCRVAGCYVTLFGWFVMFVLGYIQLVVDGLRQFLHGRDFWCVVV